MNRRISLSFLALGIIVISFSQTPTIILNFRATNNGQHVPLNSILIENLTQGNDTTLYAPDTVLMIEYISGIDDCKTKDNAFSISQNYPNPIEGKTSVSIYMPERKNTLITVSDILGRELLHHECELDLGIHSFTFLPGKESLYFLTFHVDHKTQTIKMINSTSSSSMGNYKLEYNGLQNEFHRLKSGNILNNFDFNPGDQLKYTASCTLGERTISDSPSGDSTYLFHFEANYCPETLSDIDGNTYSTVLIGSQCWMKENLKTTTYRNGKPIPNVTNLNSWWTLTTGAYVWFGHDISWKDLYGALYCWYAVVDTNGLCPTNWHVPSKDEWNGLLYAISGTSLPNGNELKSCKQVNSPLGVDCNTSDHPRWDQNNSNWGTDNYGFSGLPCGQRLYDASFADLGAGTWWWSTYDNYSLSYAWHLGLYFNTSYVKVYSYGSKNSGFSVRCLRDY